MIIFLRKDDGSYEYPDGWDYLKIDHVNEVYRTFSKIAYEGHSGTNEYQNYSAVVGLCETYLLFKMAPNFITKNIIGKTFALEIEE